MDQWGLTMTATDGWVLMPKKIGIWIVLGGFAFLGQQLWNASELKATISNDLASLHRADIEGRARGDDIRNRLTQLERQRQDLTDRLIRIEEQQKSTVEILRDVRDDVRKQRAN
jgi:hypothetical protein